VYQYAVGVEEQLVHHGLAVMHVADLVGVGVGPQVRHLKLFQDKFLQLSLALPEKVVQVVPVKTENQNAVVMVEYLKLLAELQFMAVSESALVMVELVVEVVIQTQWEWEEWVLEVVLVPPVVGMGHKVG
jgi:hypothetical protein